MLNDRNMFVKLKMRTLQRKENFLKYTDSEVGCHSALNFIRDLEFFNPSKSLIFPEVAKILHIHGFGNVGSAELRQYRIMARLFQMPDIAEAETFSEEASLKFRAIRDFWEGAKTLLPELAKLAFQNAFLVSSLAGVERSFSYRKILEPERRRLLPKTIKHCFYVNADKSFCS